VIAPQCEATRAGASHLLKHGFGVGMDLFVDQGQSRRSVPPRYSIAAQNHAAGIDDEVEQGEYTRGGERLLGLSSTGDIGTLGDELRP
jgi:hypothetical protein